MYLSTRLFLKAQRPRDIAPIINKKRGHKFTPSIDHQYDIANHRSSIAPKRRFDAVHASRVSLLSFSEILAEPPLVDALSPILEGIITNRCGLAWNFTMGKD